MLLSFATIQKMKRRSFLNLMFLIAFLIEIILSIVGISIISIFEIPIRTADFVILFFVIFLSGIYTILVKKLVYFLVFCIVHTIPITVLADDLSFFRPQDDEILKTTYVAIFTITLFVIFFMTLFIIIWRKKYWGVNSRTKISIPKNLKKSYIIYNIHVVLLYSTLCFIMTSNSLFILDTNYFLYVTNDDVALSSIYILLIFLPSFILLFSSKIIKKELRFHMLFIYLAYVGQILFFLLYVLGHNFSRNLIIWIVTIILLGFLIVSTILCHINFGKNLKFYLTFDPILDKEYEYSNDFSLDINIDEEEKDEKASETLKRYLKAIKTFFYNGVVRQILDLIK
ncbi:hypothetical protein GLOIN_2v1569580 [Rhizophagus clarus]|uniref:Uncharacterized protein n=1 Tax=Rhizophagus clarus TaxID=94130 RepID=A0A8H3QTD3_9GLOM|nr:hypothetical protein GLOIN_2v1569580 [Rhizophagus clarus]